MWVNEYKQCVLVQENTARLVWMPLNGARPDAAVDLDGDGKLWTVQHVYQEPIFDLETVKGLADGYSEHRYVEGYHGAGSAL